MLNSAAGVEAGAVVQSGSIDVVNIHPYDRRTLLMVLGATAVVMVSVVALVVWSVRSQPDNATTGQAAPQSLSTSTSSAPRPTTASPAPNAPEAARQAPAVHVDSVQYIGVPNVGSSFAFPQALRLTDAQVAELSDLYAGAGDYEERARAMGGVGPGNVAVQIALRGASAETAVITNMRTIATCGAPLTGALLFAPPGGQDDSVQIGFNLDNPSPLPQNYERGVLSGNYFLDHTVSIKKDETHALVVHGITAKKHCKFKLEITVNVGLGVAPVKQTIDDHGKAFEVTAIASQDPSSTTGPAFRDYTEIYAGGVAGPKGDARFGRVNPATYTGSGS